MVKFTSGEKWPHSRGNGLVNIPCMEPMGLYWSFWSHGPINLEMSALKNNLIPAQLSFRWCVPALSHLGVRNHTKYPGGSLAGSWLWGWYSHELKKRFWRFRDGSKMLTKHLNGIFDAFFEKSCVVVFFFWGGWRRQSSGPWVTVTHHLQKSNELRPTKGYQGHTSNNHFYHQTCPSWL